MRKLFFVAFIISILAFTDTGTSARNGYKPSNTIGRAESIGCAPPETSSGADASGKFIPPLPGLGHHTYSISTRQDSAQFYFNQGFNFYYSYHLRESLASFKEAARFDPSSAMTYWGQALAMGPYYNVYTYKMKAGVPIALAAMTSHRPAATEKEKALIDAMLRRYSSDTTNADRPQLDKAYADALSDLMKRYPGDDDLKTLYIDAVMLEHKWDFWNPDATPQPWTPELIALCEGVLKRDPHQPAALHYYIHLTEASEFPGLALAGADRLKDDMPGVGHMVHMATHMYQRNGLFAKGVTINEQSNTVNNQVDSLAPMLGLGRNNILHIYAVQSYCAMNAGMYAKGKPIYQRARDRCVAAKPAFPQDLNSQFIYMLPEIASVRLGKWDEILQAPTPDPGWKYASVLSHFARGMAYCRKGNLPAAQADLDTLWHIIDMNDPLMNTRVMPFNKPAQCGSIAGGILEGEILFAKGKQDEAVLALTKAEAEEDALIYREPQEWLIPVRQYLGLLFLKMNNAAAAERGYRWDLRKNPGNGWSLLGLYQSLVAQHKIEEAAATKIKVQQAFEASDLDITASVF